MKTTFSPWASVATVGVLLVALVLAAFRPAPLVTPLTPTSSLVILLAPNLTLQDLEDAKNAPALAALLPNSAYGVLPTRGSDSPEKEELENAIQVIASGTRLPQSQRVLPVNSSLGKSLESKNILLTPLGADARALLSLPPEEYPEEDEQEWRVVQYEFPEGHITAIDVLGTRITQALNQNNPNNSGKQVVVAVYDDLQRVDSYAALAEERATQEQHLAALNRLNNLVKGITDPHGSLAYKKGSLLLIGPTPGRLAHQRRERFGPVLLWQAPDSSQNVTPGLLTSPTTRLTPGLLGATDIAATVMTLLGSPDVKIGVGRAAQITPNDQRLDTRLYHWSAQAREQALLFYLPWVLGISLLLALWLRSVGYPQTAQTIGITLLTAPFFLTLYASSGQTYLLSGLSMVCVAMIGGCYPEKGVLALRIIATLTAFLILIDTFLGGMILSRSPLSWSAGEAVRFYGIGNEMAGVLIGMAFLALITPNSKNSENSGNSENRRLLVGMTGTLLCLTLALPTLGANNGGFFAAAVGFGFAFVYCQPNHRRKIGLFYGICVLVFILGLLVYEGNRSLTERTHLGEAVANAQSRGGVGWEEIALRKLQMNAHLVYTSPWMVLLASEILVLILHVRRSKDTNSSPDNSSPNSAILLGLVTGGVAAFLFNDSGVVAAAALLLPAASLLLLHPFQKEK